MWYKYKNIIEFTDFSASFANISYMTLTWPVISYTWYAYFFSRELSCYQAGIKKSIATHHLENKIRLLKQRIVWMFVHVWENVISVEERKNYKKCECICNKRERERICYSITTVYKCWTSNVFLLLLPHIVYDFIHNVYAYKCVIIWVIYI